jgi:hypothetical protein
MLQQLDAVHPGHFQIGKGEIKSAVFSKLDSSLA